MKAQILKIAGVKSEKEFYKKFPSEEAFMKVHGKELKKAQTSDAIEKAQKGFFGNFDDGTNQNYDNSGQGGYYPPPVEGSLQGSPGYASGATPPSFKGKGVPFNFQGFGNALGGIIGGIQNINADKKQADHYRTWDQVAGLQLKAKQTNDMLGKPPRKYNRVDDPRNIFSANSYYPAQGVGTNPITRNGGKVKKAQNGTVEEVETPNIDSAPTDIFDEGYVNRQDQIIEAQPQYEMTDADATAFMEMYNRDQGKSTATFDSNSARDTWVHKTGLPWSEAKKLGYTTGSAKDNIKLLNELNDPRFKKENLRSTAPKNSSQSRTPIQHRETPTGKLTPITNPLQAYDAAMKGKPKYNNSHNANLSAAHEDQYSREKDASRRQAEHDDYLSLERPLYYLANPEKAWGDFKSIFNPMTPESETSEGLRKKVMSNRYNPNQTQGQKAKNALKMGLRETPKAAINAAGLLSGVPYTTYETYPIGLMEGAPARSRAAGYIGEGALRLGEGAPKQLGYNAVKQLGPGAMKQIGRGAHPNFVMYEDGGEITNTFAPNTLYTDLGYDSADQVKQFGKGGQNYMDNLGYNPYGQIVGSYFGNNGGSQLAGALGSLTGNPAIAGLAGVVGGALDKNKQEGQNALDRYGRKVQKLMDWKGAFSGFSANRENGGPVYEDGGWVSNDWQPQVITQFGGHSMKDLLAPDETMDTLRSGGHLSQDYMPISNRGLQTYEDGGKVRTSALNGEVQTTWGGGVKTLSQNPNMPGTGQTIQFIGNSHDTHDGNGHTGIGVKYGKGAQDSYTDYAEFGSQNADADVEVEKEPAFEMIDPKTGEKNLTVLGALKFDKNVAAQTGDPHIMSLADKYHGERFKNIGVKLSKLENKYQDLVENAFNKSDGSKLGDATAQANMNAGKMGLKQVAQDKIVLAHFQNAINESSEENFLVADDLARGKGTYDKAAAKEAIGKYGASIEKAEGGKKIKFNSEQEAIDAGYSKGPDGVWRKGKSTSGKSSESKIAEAMVEIPKGQRESSSGLWGKVTPDNFEETKKNNPWFNWSGFDLKNKDDVKFFQRSFNERAKEIGSAARVNVDGAFGEQTASAKLNTDIKSEPGSNEESIADIQSGNTEFKPVPYKGNKLVPLANQLLGYLRPSNAIGLDPLQLAGETSALADNAEEPVQAQLYYPNLQSVSDISYQDALNEITAQNRDMQKSGYNPALQSINDARMAQEKFKVLGEQFRQNQNRRDSIYNANINTLNDADLKNLTILDNQYARQQQAKSNTKAVRQDALNSIASKYLQNKIEDKKLQTNENLYNYRYDSNGRLINLNGIYQPVIPQVYGTEGSVKMLASKDGQGNTVYKMVDDNGKEINQSSDMAYNYNSTRPAYSTDENNNLVPIQTTKSKNGKKIKSTNGSILRSIKNL